MFMTMMMDLLVMFVTMMMLMMVDLLVMFVTIVMMMKSFGMFLMP